MGTITDKLNKLLETKAAIKQAIIDKGVDVGEDTKFADYPSKIAAIESGGETYENPDFYEIRTAGGTNYEHLFANATQTPDFSTWDTSKATTMGYMFYLCTNLKSLDLSSFNTSNVTNMNYMFHSCTQLTSLVLSTWDTSKVTNMANLFYSCSKLLLLDLSGWNTSKVTNMNSMFYSCRSLTSLDVSNFDTSKVTNMNYLFNACSNLTTITGEFDLSGLTNGFFPGSYNHPTKGCTSLETLYLKNIYKNCTMTNNSKWSIDLGETKVKDECLISIINELPDLINDKGLTTTSSIIFTLPPTNTLTAEQVQPAIDKGWSVANTTY